MKRLFSRLVCVTMILALFTSYLPATAMAEEIPYGKTKLQSLPNAQALLFVYEQLDDGVKDVEESIDLSHPQYTVSVSELKTVFELFFCDHPDYFWLKDGFGYHTQNNVICSLEPAYNDTVSNLSSAKTKIKSKVDELCRGLNGKSDYEKTLILHDRLVLQTSYVSGKNDQNAYGALVEGKAVCAGYSRAYQLLLQEVGIPAWTVTGESYHPSTGGKQAHEWNLVSVDGAWYYTDVTWDDQGSAKEDVFYSYLNITTEQMEESHILSDISRSFVPKATSKKANYFAINGGVYTEWDQAALVKQLKENEFVARVYADMKNPENYLKQFKDNIGSIIDELGITGSYNYRYRELDHEFVFTIHGTVGKTTTRPAQTTTSAKKTTTAAPVKDTETVTTTSAAATTEKQSVTTSTVPAVDKNTTVTSAVSTSTEWPSTVFDGWTSLVEGDSATTTDDSITETATTTSEQLVTPNEDEKSPVVMWIVIGAVGAAGLAIAAVLLLKKR